MDFIIKQILFLETLTFNYSVVTVAFPPPLAENLQKIKKLKKIKN